MLELNSSQCFETTMRKVDFENWDKEVTESEIPVLVFFKADWSPSCVEVAELLKEVSSEYEGRIKSVYVDYDSERELVLQKRVYVPPTIIIFYKGIPVRGVPGPAPAKVIKNCVDRALRVVERVKAKSNSADTEF